MHDWCGLEFLLDSYGTVESTDQQPCSTGGCTAPARQCNDTDGAQAKQNWKMEWLKVKYINSNTQFH